MPRTPPPASPPDASSPGTSPASPLSVVLIALLKGVVHAEGDATLWHALLDLQAQVRDYVDTLGLELLVDESEGYAYLRQRPAEEGVEALPRLVPRRQLSYPVSLVLVLLRKKLADHDRSSAEGMPTVTRDELAEALRIFLPDTANQARFMDRLDAHLNRIVDLGFLRKLRGQGGRFEVRRILKSFVDAQWLADFDARLEAYRVHAADEDDATEAEG